MRAAVLPAVGEPMRLEREIDRAQCLPGRLQPADIARMALWLAADDSRMCTSQTWVVDGGWI